MSFARVVELSEKGKEAMRPQFALLMSLGLLSAALGCHTTGVCDCDVHANPHLLAPVPAPGPAVAPAPRAEPIPMPKPAEETAKEKGTLSIESMVPAQ